MRAFLIPVAALALFAGNSVAEAAVAITVNKDLQQMTVSVDGVPRYNWPVSSGNPSHETPNGSFRTFRMEEDHYSKEFDDAPMPHAIFFTKQGHAIHGTDSASRLGTPVSHGCVRLSRANATTLWNLVKQEGLLSTTVTLTGSSRVALARNPRTNVASRNAGDANATHGQPLEIAPESPVSAPGYGNSFFGETAEQAYPDSAGQDRVYRQRSSQDRVVQQDRSYYGDRDMRWPSQQRRVYPDPRSNGGYIQESRDPDQRYPRQVYPQSGYAVYD